MSKPKAFLDEESSFQGKYSRQVFETLFCAYRPFLLKLVVLLSIGFVSRLVLLGNANVIGMWVDTLCREPAVCRPVPEFFAGFGHQDFLKLLGLMTLTGFLLTVFFRVGFSRLSSLAVSRLYDETTLRTSRLPIQFFDSNPVGRVVTRFSSDYGSVFRLFGGPLAEFFAIIFDLAAMLILVSVASPFYIPIMVAITLANFAVYRLNRDRLRLERRDLSASRSPSIAHFAETAQGASTIRIFSRQRTFGERFSILNERYLTQKLSATTAVLRFSMQMSSLTAFLLLMTGTLGYFLSAQGLVSIGSIGVAFTFVILSGTSLQTFFEWLGQLEEAMTGVERLNDYLRRDLEPGSKLPASRSFETSHPVYAPGEEAALRRARMVPQAAAGVTVEGLWFRYGSDLPWVLKGLDFAIRPGEKIGIVGRTGSGKTSFVQALFHLYPIERGRILVDGIRPRLKVAAGGEIAGASEADLGLFRRSIALISQEPTLFRGTLRENLDLTGSCQDHRLHEVLARVGLQEWLESQTLGLGMMIEERGKNLSAGEKQLLCMARCLLQDAPVVVMDEATSSVDPQSEEILVRATREFFADRTQIIIAHRLSTLDDCDRILWLHKGEIRMFDRPEVVLPVFTSTELHV
jgi:ABC-type multidrug transport system fused ATPase/permease subunit